MEKTIVVYRLDDTMHYSAPKFYTFTDTIKVRIYDNLEINFNKLDVQVLCNILYDLRPSTLDRYCGVFENYILNSEIGMVKLKSLKASNLQTFYNSLINDKNKSPNIIKTINKLLKTGLNQAAKEHTLNDLFADL